MFKKHIENYIAGQYRRPTGLVGWWIGRKMAEQHRSENLWTVQLLDLKASDRVLEIGFGSGFAVEEVVKHVTTGLIGGVDFSQTMVSAAKRRNAQAVRSGRADLRYGDAAHLPFDDSTFDKVFSINSIYFWMQPFIAFQEIRRVLKPDGLLVMTFLPLERWDTTFGVPTPTADFKPYSGEELQSLLAQAGFMHIQAEADPNMENRSNYSVIGQKSANDPA